MLNVPHDTLQVKEDTPFSMLKGNCTMDVLTRIDISYVNNDNQQFAVCSGYN